MTHKPMRILVVQPPDTTLPQGTEELLSDRGWEVTTAATYREALVAAGDGSTDAVLVRGPKLAGSSNQPPEEFTNLLRILDAQRIATILLDDAPRQTRDDSKSLTEIVRSDITAAEVCGRLAMIDRYHGHLLRMELELRNMERLSKQLNEHFRELDSEMRLAGRLQRDFLPRIKSPIRNAQFATVYRPASWVSGDMFDVFRIDERHTGFYVADAVGHGMAASLLTLFIKRAMTAKKVDGDRYTILTPSETLAGLNQALVEQALPNCQFITAGYGIIDHDTLVLRYVGGGHPYPILMGTGGVVSELKTSGPLLGLFAEAQFPTFETQLQPGDKVLLYTDGVECAFQTQNSKRLAPNAYRQVFESLAGQPIRDMLRQIETQLDDESDSLNSRDDVTIVGVEILDDPPVGKMP